MEDQQLQLQDTQFLYVVAVCKRNQVWRKGLVKQTDVLQLLDPNAKINQLAIHVPKFEEGPLQPASWLKSGGTGRFVTEALGWSCKGNPKGETVYQLYYLDKLKGDKFPVFTKPGGTGCQESTGLLDILEQVGDRSNDHDHVWKTTKEELERRAYSPSDTNYSKLQWAEALLQKTTFSAVPPPKTRKRDKDKEEAVPPGVSKESQEPKKKDKDKKKAVLPGVSNKLSIFKGYKGFLAGKAPAKKRLKKSNSAIPSIISAGPTSVDDVTRGTDDTPNQGSALVAGGDLSAACDPQSSTLHAPTHATCCTVSRDKQTGHNSSNYAVSGCSVEAIGDLAAGSSVNQSQSQPGPATTLATLVTRFRQPLQASHEQLGWQNSAGHPSALTVPCAATASTGTLAVSTNFAKVSPTKSSSPRSRAIARGMATQSLFPSPTSAANTLHGYSSGSPAPLNQTPAQGTRLTDFNSPLPVQGAIVQQQDSQTALVEPELTAAAGTSSLLPAAHYEQNQDALASAATRPTIPVSPPEQEVTHTPPLPASGPLAEPGSRAPTSKNSPGGTASEQDVPSAGMPAEATEGTSKLAYLESAGAPATPKGARTATEAKPTPQTTGKVALTPSRAKAEDKTPIYTGLFSVLPVGSMMKLSFKDFKTLRGKRGGVGELQLVIVEHIATGATAAVFGVAIRDVTPRTALAELVKRLSWKSQLALKVYVNEGAELHAVTRCFTAETSAVESTVASLENSRHVLEYAGYGIAVALDGVGVDAGRFNAVLMERCKHSVDVECEVPRKYGSDEEFMAIHSRYSRQMVMGLIELSNVQGAHLVHRDLKAQNLLITATDQLKITDFGASILLGEGFRSSTRTRIGTFGNMAPELVWGRKYDSSVTQWGVGCVAYQLWRGHLPFQDDEHLEQMQLLETEATVTAYLDRQFSMQMQHADQKTARPFPQPLADFIRYCLVWDPKERPSLADILAHPFLTLAAESDNSDSESELE